MTKKIFYSLFALAVTSPLFAQEEESMRSQGSFWQTLIMIAIAIIFFYFILWRPEQKKRKAIEEKRQGMKKGDKITAMGIVGTIDRVKEQTVIVKMVDDSKIEFLKAAITEVRSRDDEKEQEAST